MRVLVINGPNLNLLGSREPEIYGSATLADLERMLAEWGTELEVGVETFQSNHEGALIDRIHQQDFDGLLINAGALTHYSYALHDALVAIPAPTVEVHISDVHARETWRRRSVIAPACTYTIFGRGVPGYRWALLRLIHDQQSPSSTIRYGDGPEEVAELRLPDAPGPHQVAVLIHGGFWENPWTRDTLDALAIDLTDRGWATWNVEYRRVGAGGGWPTTMEDVADAIDHLANLDAPLDLDHVVAVGHSAGGQLALWAGATNSRRSVQLQRIVGLAPVADLAGAHGDYDAGTVEAFLRRSPGHERYTEASPTERLPIGVPQFIAHGAVDELVPVEVSRRYTEAASAAGDEVTFLELDGVDHFGVIDPSLPWWTDSYDDFFVAS